MPEIDQFIKAMENYFQLEKAPRLTDYLRQQKLISDQEKARLKGTSKGYTLLIVQPKPEKDNLELKCARPITAQLEYTGTEYKWQI